MQLFLFSMEQALSMVMDELVFYTHSTGTVLSEEQITDEVLAIFASRKNNQNAVNIKDKESSAPNESRSCFCHVTNFGSTCDYSQKIQEVY